MAELIKYTKLPWGHCTLYRLKDGRYVIVSTFSSLLWLREITVFLANAGGRTLDRNPLIRLEGIHIPRFRISSRVSSVLEQLEVKVTAT